MTGGPEKNRKKRMSESYRPATQPTLYFIGVSTAKSSIMTIFPQWAEYLGIPEAQILGIDFPIHAEPASYRRAVEFIKADPLSQGALVTTHKIDLFSACRDLFDEIDRHALLMGEISCISKREGKVLCHAKDPISSGLTLDGFLPPDHWKDSGAEVFIMGAGGAAIAITWHLMRGETQEEANRPSRLLVSDPQPSRLAEIRHIHAQFHSKVPVEYIQVSDPRDNDSVANQLKTGSLVINATGLGKDAPGSPLTEAARFPANGIVWELNYRGDLVFVRQANAQKVERNLQIEDGWTYFIHGWTRVIAEVFHLDIPVSGETFNRFAEIAVDASDRRGSQEFKDA
jgi:shikimate 5-dehydrogenase